MIETAPRLGKLRRAGLACVAALALGGCADAFFALVGAGADTRNLEVRSNIAFDAEHDLHLDAYLPRNAADAPVVVFFYGGSWTEAAAAGIATSAMRWPIMA